MKVVVKRFLDFVNYEKYCDLNVKWIIICVSNNKLNLFFVYVFNVFSIFMI